MIDVHSHFFNLKYLPVAGILRRFSHNVIPHPIAVGIERLLLKGTKSSIPLNNVKGLKIIPDNRDEVPVLEMLNKELPIGAETSIFELSEEECINRILNNVTESDIKDPLVVNALDTFQTIQHVENKGSISFDINLAAEESLTLSQSEEAVSLVGDLLKWITEKIEDGRNYLRWFSFMQKSEHEMLEHLRKTDAPKVNTFVHQLMDVDAFFNSEKQPKRYRSFFSYDVQIKKMEKLNKEFPGILIGMVAFDPTKKNCIEIVKDAIENRGYKGIKFYPPLGYRAFEDPRYSKNITKLLDYCVAGDIPLFAHCNKQGFEANKDSGHNSNPMFWKRVLQQPKYNNLRLCLAHAGGVEGWFVPIAANEEIDPNTIVDLPNGIDENQVSWNTSYAKIVYQLCLKFPNVYCDAAYLDEVTQVQERNNFRDRLNKLFTAQPAFSKKIIYGSDWHMLFQEGKNAAYMQDYIDLFDEPVFTNDHRADFFEKNAQRYLN